MKANLLAFTSVYWRLLAFMHAPAGVAARSRSKPLRLERGGIDEWRRADHQVREEAAGDGAEREAEMVVPDVEPQAWLAREGPNDRPHVRQAGAPAEPGRGVLSGPDGEQFARVGLDPLEMRRRGRIVAPGEFGARRQSEPPRHRGHEVAALEIEHRTRQARVVLGLVVAWVA